MNPEQQVRSGSATLTPYAKQLGTNNFQNAEDKVRQGAGWAWNQYNDMSNAIPPSVDMGIHNVPMAGLAMLGSLREAPGISKVISKIHPDDIGVMEKLIDSVRLGPPNPAVELDASRVAEHYGLPMPKTTNGLANSFDNILQTRMQMMKGK